MRSGPSPIATPLATSDRASSSVTTTMIFDAPAAAVWERLMFYEQIDERPPLHLRLLLPVPIETVGDKSHVGDEARCLYEGGHLVKRVTQIEPGQRYAFEVVEQELSVGGGMRLAGGEYRLRALDAGRAEITVATRYSSPKRPRWLWRPIENAVCHSFHRHILRAMRRGVARAGGDA
jgi:dipeptidyl aminopeptidase/acylaminoacyl peptidase